jgi:hypothetical protein
LTLDQIDREIAGTPEAPQRIVTAPAFHGVKDVGGLLLLQGKSPPAPLDHQPDLRRVIAGRNLVAVLYRGKDVGLLDLQVHRGVVRAKVHGRLQFQAHLLLAGNQPVDEVQGVLLMHQDQLLFDHRVLDLIAPDRQSVLQAKAGEVLHAVEVELSPFLLVAAELDDVAVGKPDHLGDSVQHHGAPQRRRVGSDQQAVIAAGQGAANGAGGIASQAVGHQPLPFQ